MHGEPSGCTTLVLRVGSRTVPQGYSGQYHIDTRAQDHTKPGLHHMGMYNAGGNPGSLQFWAVPCGYVSDWGGGGIDIQDYTTATTWGGGKEIQSPSTAVGYTKWVGERVTQGST